MSCAKGKDTYPDLQTALVSRNEIIRVYGSAQYAYKCLGGCGKWHLTSRRPNGKRIKRWNNIATPEQMEAFNGFVKACELEMLTKASRSDNGSEGGIPEVISSQ